MSHTLTDDILHPEEVPAWVIGPIEVDLDVEALSTPHNETVAVVLVRVVVHLIAVPPLLEQVYSCHVQVIWCENSQ